jgi:RNA polymerase sigma factor (sigma-70 family)
MKKKNWDKIFEKELMPFADALKTFAYHLTYDESDAEDLVQDTLLKAYKSIERYEVGTNAKAWLFKILKNGFINDYRRRVKQPNKVDYEEILALDQLRGFEGGNV